jgi:transposase
MASPQTLQERALDQACQAMLFVALELSDKKWKLALSDGNKRRIVTIAAGDLVTLGEAVAKAKARFGMPGGVPIVSCYEAGRDGFWLHRYLVHCGVANVVVDASSIEVNRRARRAKTDRVDVEQLLRLLMRYHHGEKRVWSVVRVPSVEEEDARRLHRELERLKKERTGHRNRIQALLVSQGVRLQPRHDLLERLEAARLWDGSALPPDLQAEVRREDARLRSVDEQIRALEAEQARRLEEAATPCYQQVAQLMRLRGIGLTSAWVFVMEYFGWRQFHNRKEVAALAGLTPMPYASGDSTRDQGISKAGNRRIRTLMIQIAWGWLRYQPHSALSVWFNTRFALGGKRMRRIGIVALARRLLIALWRYVQSGAIPESASLKPL